MAVSSMLPRAQDIASLCRHWLRTSGGAPSPERMKEALRALQELLGATGAAITGPSPVGFLASGDLDHEGGGELVGGDEGVSRKAGVLARRSAASGEHRVTAVFRFPFDADDHELLERVGAAAQAFVDATVAAAPKEERFGEYALIARLGEGGMGQIHLGRAPGGGLVAIKRISRHLAAEPRFLEMFSREVQAATQIVHPNVVKILEYGVSDGQAFLVMEYLQGASLARLNFGAQSLSLKVPWEVSLGLAMRYCRGLQAAHDAGVIHCDISPQNLFVTFDGEAKVIDFGLAQTLSAGEQRRDRARGKMGYVAPEQLMGDASDHRVDLFALGVVLYELLSRRSVEASWRTYAGGGFRPLIEIAPEVPQVLNDAVMKALEFSAANRPSSAVELEVMLAQAASAAGIAGASHETISRFMRDALGDSEAHQKRLLSGPVSGPVDANTKTARLE